MVEVGCWEQKFSMCKGAGALDGGTVIPLWIMPQLNILQCYTCNTVRVFFGKMGPKQYFPYENHRECYKKLAWRSWPVLFTLTDFFLIHTLSSSAGKKSCFDHSFPQWIRPQTTVQWYILWDYSSVRIGFSFINKRHTQPFVYTILVSIIVVF